MSRVPQGRVELEKQLKEQLELLSLLASQYDDGKAVMAKPIATTIRVLVHNTGRSKSLLGQMGLMDTSFLDTALSLEGSFGPGAKRVGAYCGLVAVGMVMSHRALKMTVAFHPEAA